MWPLLFCGSSPVLVRTCELWVQVKQVTIIVVIQTTLTEAIRSKKASSPYEFDQVRFQGSKSSLAYNRTVSQEQAFATEV